MQHIWKSGMDEVAIGNFPKCAAAWCSFTGEIHMGVWSWSDIPTERLCPGCVSSIVDARLKNPEQTFADIEKRALAFQQWVSKA